MQIYKNRNGDSGVTRYKCGPDWIEVEFKQGSSRIYRYDYSRPGSAHVEEMKRLADAGSGLNAYINRNVREFYESKR